MKQCRYIMELATCSLITRLLLLLKAHISCSHVNAVGGLPILNIQGNLHIDRNKKVTFINNAVWSTLGASRRCKLSVYKGAELIFRGRAGVSNAVIVATKRIEIGDNVMIGGGVTIVDSDFHSLNFNDWFTDNDAPNANSKPVFIGDNVFIGMHSIILKGVNIGSGVIVAAGSVVTKDIPENEVWGGNPAKFIKKRN